VTPRLVFRREAESEILDAFVAEVDRPAAGIVEHPLAYPHVHGETRRALVHRFPYAIYFRAMSDEVVVLAVMHGRRLPRRWRSRR
jgi:plasmid stabilization system protein ParE